MRISTAYQFESYANSISTAQQNLFTTQQQVTSGIKLNSPTDDPVAFQKVLSMQSLQSALGQYQANLGHAKSILTTTDSSLMSAGSIMNTAYQTAIQASTGTVDDATRQNFVDQITQLQQQLVSNANDKGPDGEYLFAGQKTDTKPFTVTDGALVYAGDGNDVQISAGPNDTVTVNVPGTPLFSDAYNALSKLKADLQSNNQGAISNDDIAAIQSSQSSFTFAQGTIGARSASVSTLTNNNVRRISDLTSQISDLKNIDTAQAITNYTAAQNAYQAALTVVSSASSLSLMNYLSGH